MLSPDHDHDYLSNDEKIRENEKKTTIVVILTAIMMIIEVSAGYITGSMALLADGWHMASHAGALTIALIAYRLAKNNRLTKNFSFGAGKFIPLGGYTSAIVLALIAILMAVESGQRIFNPVNIQFSEAILVAVVGLVVNIASAFILSHDHHHDDDPDHDEHHHHDHNLRSAYVHVIADALTSVLAIIALTLGLYFGATWLDPAMGLVGSAVILKWAFNLCKEAGWELLDGHSKSINLDDLKHAIEKDGATILDLHTWKIAPSAIACSLTIKRDRPMGHAHYRTLIADSFKIEHLTVEER
jgi:cation diffusion facilitator family transporter